MIKLNSYWKWLYPTEGIILFNGCSWNITQNTHSSIPKCTYMPVKCVQPHKLFWNILKLWNFKEQSAAGFTRVQVPMGLTVRGQTNWCHKKGCFHTSSLVLPYNSLITYEGVYVIKSLLFQSQSYPDSAFNPYRSSFNFFPILKTKKKKEQHKSSRCRST